MLDGKGHLYIALGGNNQRSTAQDLGKLQGKVVRIRPTARCRQTILRGQGRRAPIWSYGHRNPQGMALNPWSGELWEASMGRAATRSI